jgi:hypothetical protein
MILDVTQSQHRSSPFHFSTFLRSIGSVSLLHRRFFSPRSPISKFPLMVEICGGFGCFRADRN